MLEEAAEEYVWMLGNCIFQADFKFHTYTVFFLQHSARYVHIYVALPKYSSYTSILLPLFVNFMAIAPSPIPVVKTPMRLLSQNNQLH